MEKTEGIKVFTARKEPMGRRKFLGLAALLGAGIIGAKVLSSGKNREPLANTPTISTPNQATANTAQTVVDYDTLRKEARPLFQFCNTINESYYYTMGRDLQTDSRELTGEIILAQDPELREKCFDNEQVFSSNGRLVLIFGSPKPGTVPLFRLRKNLFLAEPKKSIDDLKKDYETNKQRLNETIDKYERAFHGNIDTKERVGDELDSVEFGMLDSKNTLQKAQRYLKGQREDSFVSLFTTDSNEAKRLALSGLENKGALGWLFQKREKDTSPLYCLEREDGGQTLILDEENRKLLLEHGRKDRGILGYVYRPTTPDSGKTDDGRDF